MSLRQFPDVDVDDVITAVRQLPDKSFAIDPLPMNVLKQVIDLLTPFVTESCLTVRSMQDISRLLLRKHL